MFNVRSAIALVVLSLTPLGVFANGGGDCELGDNWETVDTFALAENRDSGAFDSSSNRKAIFVIGGAGDISDGFGHWIVRRSLDRGETWETVEDLQVAPGKNSSGNAIATDPRNLTVYAAGWGTDAQNRVSVLVRKSTDNGETWTTIEDNENIGIIQMDLAVDPNGIVYLVGRMGSEWVVRRYDPITNNWTTVDTFKVGDFAAAFTVVTTDAGEVYVGGRAGTGVNFYWYVRHSANGMSGWTVVDEFRLEDGTQSLAVGSAFRKKDQTLAFVGHATDAGGKQYWVTRIANASAPSDWSTIDLAIPGDGFAGQGRAAVFTVPGRRHRKDKRPPRESELFVTGIKYVRSGTGTRLHFHTRRGTEEEGSFEDSDQVGEGIGYAATSDSTGNVFTAGHHRVSSGLPKWTVRKLGCE